MTVFFLHSFTGPDSNAIGIGSVPPDIGAGVLSVVGVNPINIIVSQAFGPVDASATAEYSIAAPQADIRLRCDAVASIPGGPNATRELALYLRHQPNGASYYAYMLAGSPAQIRFNNGAGSDVALATTAGSGWAAGEVATWEIEAAGSVLTLRKNGTQILQATNSGLSQPGSLRFQIRNVALDQMEAEYDAGAPPPPPPPPPAPTITTQPQALTVTAPAPATFTVAATGEGPLSYQWRRDGVAISGATAASYTLSPTSTADSGAQFSCAVTNAGGTTVSSAAALTVNPAAGSVVFALATAAGLQLGAFSGSLTGLSLAPSGQQWRAFVHDDSSRALLATSARRSVGAAGRLPNFTVGGLVAGTVYFVSLRRELDGASASFRLAAEAAP